MMPPKPPTNGPKTRSSDKNTDTEASGSEGVEGEEEYHSPAGQHSGKAGDNTGGKDGREEVIDLSNYDEQIQALEREEEALQKQLKLAEKRQCIDQMKKKLAQIKASSLTGSAPSGVPQQNVNKHSIPVGVGHNALTLDDLRRTDALQKEADDMLDGMQDDSFDDGGCEGNTNRIKKIKSGKEAKSTDAVKLTLNWPHTALKYIGQKQLNYQDLDFASLVAGELEVINKDSISNEEKWGRIELLKATAYHSKTFAWPDVQNFHGSCLLEIEKGERKWGGRETFLPGGVTSISDYYRYVPP